MEEIVAVGIASWRKIMPKREICKERDETPEKKQRQSTTAGNLLLGWGAWGSRSKGSKRGRKGVICPSLGGKKTAEL
jgi:hypothetical protein